MSSTKSVEEIKKQETWCDSHCSKTVGVWARQLQQRQRWLLVIERAFTLAFQPPPPQQQRQARIYLGQLSSSMSWYFETPPLPPPTSKPALTDIPTLCLDFYSLLRLHFLNHTYPSPMEKYQFGEGQKDHLKADNIYYKLYHISPPILHGGGCGAQVLECPI